MFIRLGILSIVRQLSRSALALVSLVLAAVSLTASLTISSGYPAQAYGNYRDYLGGDIIAFPVRIMTSANEQGDLELYRLPKNEFSTLTTFYPHITREGFLSTEQPTLHPTTEEDRESIKQNSQVLSVRPLYRLPAWRDLAGSSNDIAVRALSDADPLESYVVQEIAVDSAALTGATPVWLNARVASDSPLPSLGQEVTLTVPHLVMAPDGSVQIDDSKRSSISAQVVGFYQVPTQEATWQDEQGNAMAEQAYLDLDEVWVRESDWMTLWQLAAPGQTPQAFSLGIKVKDMGQLEAVSSELQINNPSLTVVSVPNLATLAMQSSLIDHFEFAPTQGETGGKAQLGIPQDMSKLLSLFIYLNAGLLMAARMLTGAAARRKEIGILKTLGARRKDIMLMAMTEAVVLSVIGSSIGFALTYTAALLQQFSNHVALVSILLNLVQSYGIVIGETIAIGLVFGLLPAWRLSKLTVNEVLRS